MLRHKAFWTATSSTGFSASAGQDTAEHRRGFGLCRGGCGNKSAPTRNTCDSNQPKGGRPGEGEDCKTDEPSRERSGRTESSPELCLRSTARTPHLGIARDLLP